MNNALLAMIAQGGNVDIGRNYLAGQAIADQRNQSALSNQLRMAQFARGTQPSYGLTPIFDASGNMYQLSNQGGIAQVPNPSGVPYVRPIDWRDTGDAWVGTDPITGQPRGYQPIQPPPEAMPDFQAQQEDARTGARVTAEQRAKSRLEYQNILGKAVQSISLIDALANDENLDLVVGRGRLNPLNNPIVNERAAAVRAKIDQLQGQVFLQAYESLKGGGVITEIEGSKAEAAIARIGTAQGPEDFRAALAELRGVISDGLQRAALAAERGALAVPNAEASAPQQEESVIHNGRRYIRRGGQIFDAGPAEGM